MPHGCTICSSPMSPKCWCVIRGKTALLKAGNKNDRIDARKLADLLRRAALSGVPRRERHTNFERTGPQLSGGHARISRG